jgi:hypothetical protein
VGAFPEDLDILEAGSAQVVELRPQRIMLTAATTARMRIAIQGGARLPIAFRQLVATCANVV